jgi:hypothetical protein
MTDITYAIKDWNTVFENHDSRRYKTLNWVQFPLSQDSETFVSLARTEAGTLALGVFGALVQLAGRAPVRGVLRDEKGPYTPERYSKRFGLPLEVTRTAWLTLEGEGWLYQFTGVCRGEARDQPGAPECAGVERGMTRDTQQHTTEQDIVVVGEADLRRKALREAGISPGKTLEELSATNLRPSRIAMIAADVRRGGGKSGAVVTALRAEAANPAPLKPDTPLRPRESAPEPPVDPEAEKQRLRAKLETASGAARRMFEDQLRKLEGAA